MKKRYARLFAALICGAVLVGMIPGRANATELEGKKMPRQDSAVTYENTAGEVHHVADFEGLAQVAHIAASRAGQYTCICENDTALVMTRDLKITPNLRVEIKGDLVVPQGKRLLVQGSLSAQSVGVEGTVQIDVEAEGIFHGNVAVSGTVEVYGSITVNAEAGIPEKITFMEDSRAKAYCRFESEEDLRTIAKQVEDSKEVWKVTASSNCDGVHISQPITLPDRLNLKIMADGFVFSGQILTMHGGLEICDVSGVVVENILRIGGESHITGKAGSAQPGVVFESYVTNLGYMKVYAPVVFQSGIKNLHVIDIWCEEGGQVVFQQPEKYEDVSQDEVGTIFVNSDQGEFPAKAFTGMKVEDFAQIGYLGTMGYPFWYLEGYSRSVPHQHRFQSIPGKAATCLEAGLSEGAYCTECGELLVVQEPVEPLPHTYTNEKDADCNVCGVVRILDFAALTTPMYRLYNPNSGEHFYTGSMEEKENLVAAGWNYEGIAWNAPIRGGDPVYRLYNPNSGDHHYTMSEVERDNLVAVGWQYEGVCWNSAGAADRNSVELFRLYNPNADCGSHHYTNSPEERDMLVEVGWMLEGIGWFGAGDHEHMLGEATCSQAATCRICGVQRGETREHAYQDATCFEPETCIDCGATRGEAVGHNYVLGSCIMCGFPDPEFM